MVKRAYSLAVDPREAALEQMLRGCASTTMRPRHVSAETPAMSPRAATAATQASAKREGDPGRRGRGGGDGFALSTARV